MSRRIFIAIAIGILAALVIALSWWYFFGRAAPAPAPKGAFGTGQTATGTQPLPTVATNIPGSVSQGGIGAQGGVNANNGSLPRYSAPGYGQFTSSTTFNTTPGVTWIGGPSGSGGFTGGSGVPFNPSAINQLNNGQVGGSVNVLGNFTNPSLSSGGNPSGLAAGLIGGVAVACSAFLVGGGAGIFTSSSLVSVQVNNSTSNNKSFMDCLARTIARAAVQQITNSTINWINSGFNGKPSFVTNYQQFFLSVADQAAGSFIQNYTNFAPFCTPFAKQIQIALAQSYARRNTAPSCSLSTLLGTNLNNFINGKFSQGGWQSLISFTTIPSNNPYGAYITAQGKLGDTLAQAQQNANRNISPGGFLNFQKPTQCTSTGGGTGPIKSTVGYACPQGCKCDVTTPGSTIEAALSKTLSVSQDTLTQAGISGSFDAIISALISQLMTRALQGGVSSLSGTDGYSSYYLTPDQQAAQAQGQTLLTQLEGLVTVAQQYGQTEQGQISDIENTQSQLNNLANCWAAYASSSPMAANNEAAAESTLHSFDSQINSLNAQITRANGAIATLQDLQTRTLSVASTADVAAIQNALAQDDAQGILIGNADLTSAQQDRTTLQAHLSSINQGTAAGLQQCYAFH